MKKILILNFIFLIAGCAQQASPPIKDYEWVKSNPVPGEFETARQECMDKAMPASYGNQDNLIVYFFYCMKSRGWQWQEK